MSTWAQNLSKILVNTSHVPTLFITSHFINLIPTASVYITALMVNSLVPLLNLFVHYFSNESSKSLNKLENHPNMFMLEFYNGVKGCINKAFLRNRKILLYMKNHAFIVFAKHDQVSVICRYRVKVIRCFFSSQT